MAEDATETFDIFAVNVPGVRHDLRSSYWAGKPKNPIAPDAAAGGAEGGAGAGDA